MPKPALGRGLGALLGGGSAPTPGKAPHGGASGSLMSSAGADGARSEVQTVPIDRVHPCPFQPRKEFTQTSIEELADSIRQQGVVQPLLVRPRGADFELIAGERRWRAAQAAGLTAVPVVVRVADDRTVLELALIENLQRENLNPIEEGQGYSQLMSQFQLTQEEVSTKVGKSRAAVANSLRLLKLAPEAQAMVRDGRLSLGHAKVILGLGQASQQRQAAERVIQHAWSVRQLEEWIARIRDSAPGNDGKTPTPGSGTPSRDIHVTSLEDRLQERLGTKVRMRYKNGQGAIEIRFFNDTDLERILQIVGVQAD